MILGIVSDTHGFFHPALPEVFASVDMILHAGDFGRVEVLNQLESIAPTRGVYGNVDGQEIRKRVPRHQHLDVDGVTIWMTHIGGRPGRWDVSVREKLFLNPPHIFICGHSHILRIERVGQMDNMLYVNPGAAGREGFHRKKTCLRLELSGGGPKTAEVVHLDEWAVVGSQK